jgi:protein O-mannosyl-transferase
VGFVVAERILYLPSVGYCLLIGLGLGKLINFKVQPCKGNSNGAKSRLQKAESLRRQANVRSMAAILFLIILISACSLKTIRRNGDWRDEESLYRSGIKVNPPKGNFSLLCATKLCRFIHFAMNIDINMVD